MGVFAAGSRPPECSAPIAAMDCPEPAHPELVPDTPVASFDLDRLEVINSEFADWLNTHIGLWQPPGDDGIVRTRRMPMIQLLRQGLRPAGNRGCLQRKNDDDDTIRAKC
jgi:hypothetical protein